MTKDEMIDKLAQNDVDSMDLNNMIQFVYETSQQYYQKLSAKKLKILCNEYLNLDDEELS